MFTLRTLQKYKAINICYFFAIITAFILSLTHNNKVEASTDAKDYFTYLIDSDELESSNDSAMSSPIEGETINSLKTMFDMVDNMMHYQNIEKEITVNKGDTLISTLTKAGVVREDANKIYYSLKPYFNPTSLKAGQKIKAIMEIDTKDSTTPARINYMVINISASERVITARNQDNFETFLDQDELTNKTFSSSGEINNNLSISMQNVGIPMRTVNNFINLFAFSIDFRRDLKKGDKFEIVYESQINKNNEIIKSGKIIYAALQLRNKTFVPGTCTHIELRKCSFLETQVFLCFYCFLT